ncbi:MAG: UPF0147 family protein, partial [Nanoarchaeota archaeon]
MDISDVIAILSQIEEDSTVPKNIRSKVRNASSMLQQNDGKAAEVKIDRIIQELDELGSDPNMPMYTRTQIWEIIS